MNRLTIGDTTNLTNANGIIRKYQLEFEQYTSNNQDQNESCPITEQGTVSPNLNIHMPSLNYRSLSGEQNIWVDFEFYRQNEEGEMLWKLKEFSVN